MKKLAAILLVLGFTAGLSSCNRDRCPNYLQHDQDQLEQVAPDAERA